MSVDLRTFSSTQQHQDTRAVQHGHTGTTLDRPKTRQRRLLLTARSVAPQLSPSPVLPPRPRPCPPTSTRDDQPQHTPFRRLGSSTTARSPSQQELVLPTPLSSPLPARTDDQPRRGYYRRRGGDQRTDQLAVVAGGRGALLRVLRRGAGAERRSLQVFRDRKSSVSIPLSIRATLQSPHSNLRHLVMVCPLPRAEVRASSLVLRCAGPWARDLDWLRCERGDDGLGLDPGADAEGWEREDVHSARHEGVSSVAA